MITNELDGAFLSEPLNDGTCDRAINFKLVHHSGTGDAENFGDFTCDFSPALFIEENIVVELVLYLDLGPGLFLRLGRLL